MNELERSLVALGRELAVPDAPDFVSSVREQIAPRRAPVRRRRWAVAVVVVLVAALGATLAIPDARSAFLDIFTIGGERIEIVDELPEVEAVADLESTLGEQLTLDEVRARSEFELRELDEEPDRVYSSERGSVWFLYGTPENVRLLVSQTPRHEVDEPTLLKKLAGSGTTVEEVRVNGSDGLFLSGEPHFLFLVDENGKVVEDSARLAADVLIWDEGGVAYRLEGDLTLEQALELARSLGP